MPGIVTRRFRIHNAEQFHEAFSETASTNMYVFISRVTPWDDDNSPPTPTDSIQNTEYDAWRRMIAAKRVQAGDVTYAVPRYNWTTSKVYREYDDQSTTLFDAPASSNTFYVINSSYNVYKCLFNNKGGASTIEPTGTSTSTLVTGDGYQWKFMYSVDAGSALKFLTDSWIPVKTLTADDGSAQWDVQAAAANGAINIIDVRAGGSSYLTNVGTFTDVTSSTIMDLAAGASATDNIYNDSSLYIASGTGAGQVRKIVDYVGANKRVTVSPAFTVTPTTLSTYVVGPTITITGDGSGAEAYANVASGAVNYINMVNVGSNYSFANVAITANSSHGSAATAQAYVAPPLGHGADPVDELGGHNVILNVQLTGSESGDFPATNEFRTLGLMRDPLTRAGGVVATDSTYTQTTKLNVSSVTSSGNYTLDEVVRGNTSGATGIVVRFANTNLANTSGAVHTLYTSANGTFQSAETVTGLSSGITATLDSTTYGELKENTGDVVYTENRGPISRAEDQIEDIKLIVKF
jgi:hypothetical protein